MRTKTLIIASAALAVGILTSSAQTYSQNIVGYVSQTLPYNGSAASSHGWANVCTPLDLAAGNSLTNLFPNPAPGGPGTGPLDFDLVYVWNGNGYTEYTLDSDYASGVGNGQDADTIEPYAPNIAPGTLVYLLNNGGNVSVPTTNVLAGTVHVDAAPTGSQTVGTTTTVLNKGLNFVASKLPIGGGLNSVLQLQVGATGGNGQLDFSTVYVPNIVNGQFLGYAQYTVDSDYTCGYGNAQDSDNIVEPTVPVGVGIIINYTDGNGTGLNTYNWVQTY